MSLSSLYFQDSSIHSLCRPLSDKLVFSAPSECKHRNYLASTCTYKYLICESVICVWRDGNSQYLTHSSVNILSIFHDCKLPRERQCFLCRTSCETKGSDKSMRRNNFNSSPNSSPARRICFCCEKSLPHRLFIIRNFTLNGIISNHLLNLVERHISCPQRNKKCHQKFRVSLRVRDEE